MMEITRTTLGIAVGIAGTLFLGYCVYFDQQRRKDPLFKKKLRERRLNAQQNASRSRTLGGPVPDMNDHEAMQRFFLQQVYLVVLVGVIGCHGGNVERMEWNLRLVMSLLDSKLCLNFFTPFTIQLGEELLAAGDLEAGVEHLGQAVAVCGQTEQLLSVLQQTMPAPIFHLLLKKLPEVSERLRSSMKARSNVMQEEDVE